MADILKINNNGTWTSVLAMRGEKGDTGETGATGPQGDIGPQGPAGRDGAIQYTAGTNINIDTTTNTISTPATTTSVSTTGTSTDEVQYITIDGVEKKLAGGKAPDEKTIIINDDGVIETAAGGWKEPVAAQAISFDNWTAGATDFDMYDHTKAALFIQEYLNIGLGTEILGTMTCNLGVVDCKFVTGIYDSTKPKLGGSGAFKSGTGYQYSNEMYIDDSNNQGRIHIWAPNLGLTSIDNITFSFPQYNIYHKIDSNYLTTGPVDGITTVSGKNIKLENTNNNTSFTTSAAANIALGDSNQNIGTTGSLICGQSISSVTGFGNIICGQSNINITTAQSILSGYNNNNKTLDNAIVGGKYNITTEKLGCGIMIGQYLTTGWPSMLTATNIFGKSNIADPTNEYVVIVGNGASSSSRSNCYTLDWQGNAVFAGTVSSVGADYAEYFEWLNVPNGRMIGYLVTLEGDKIKLADGDDDVLGITSGTATILGDDAEWYWHKRYLQDELGCFIYEDYDVEHPAEVDPTTGEIIIPAYTEHVHTRKQNPEWNPDEPYERRADRFEWQAVGMMGKLFVRDDGTSVVGSYIKPSNGIATASTERTNMRVIERINDHVVKVVLK